MSQIWTSDVYALDHEGDIDLTNMEDMFNTLRTMFSGTSAPAFVGAGLDVGMPWFDTGSGPLNDEDVLRIYDGALWRGIMHGSVGTDVMKIWVYSNTALDGWTIDAATPTDKVLALRGGNYGASGGVLSTSPASWTQPSHVLTIAEMPVHDHTYTRYVGLIPTGGPGVGGWKDTTTEDTSETGSDNSHNHGTSYRPYAAVGTLQHLES